MIDLDEAYPGNQLYCRDFGPTVTTLETFRTVNVSCTYPPGLTKEDIGPFTDILKYVNNS